VTQEAPSRCASTPPTTSQPAAHRFQRQPSISRREARTEVLVRDGETTVIGGIYTRRNSEAWNEVPVLSKIPVLGWLFKKKAVTDDRTEPAHLHHRASSTARSPSSQPRRPRPTRESSRRHGHEYRWFILLPALLGVSCSTKMNSALVVSKMVLGTLTTLPGPPPTSYCTYDPGGRSSTSPGSIPPPTRAAPWRDRRETTCSTLGDQRVPANSATFHPHQAVADYQETQPGGVTVTQQIIPVSGSVPREAAARCWSVLRTHPRDVAHRIVRVTFQSKASWTTARTCAPASVSTSS